jgi:hypothetical protein
MQRQWAQYGILMLVHAVLDDLEIRVGGDQRVCDILQSLKKS